jgi:hypothetical protein
MLRDAGLDVDGIRAAVHARLARDGVGAIRAAGVGSG